MYSNWCMPWKASWVLCSGHHLQKNVRNGGSNQTFFFSKVIGKWWMKFEYPVRVAFIAQKNVFNLHKYCSNNMTCWIYLFYSFWLILLNILLSKGRFWFFPLCHSSQSIFFIYYFVFCFNCTVSSVKVKLYCHVMFNVVSLGSHVVLGT